MAELSSQPTSVQSLYGWYSDNRLFVNRRYQRKLVWTLEEKQRLIESIIKKYPIPAILLSEKEDDPGRYEIIDGLQRMNAIVSFIEGSFPDLTGRYFDISLFPTAQARMDGGQFKPLSQDNKLTSREVTTLLDYSLALSIMRGATNEEVDDVFDRINSYGRRLSDQERRQAGIQNEFSDLVREVSCKIRGDSLLEVMPLSAMPEISIDLPMTKHGYDVKAEDVFWVRQGILRATDLRDSMDEQCVADIIGSIVSGSVLERSKDTLDKLYERESDEANQLIAALNVYGSDKLSDELEFCVKEIDLVCAANGGEKLRNIIFKERTTNAFPAVFSLILLAFYELFVRERKSIASYKDVRGAIINLTERIVTSRGATAADERRKNIDTIKALILPYFVDVDPAKAIYANHTSLDIDSYIRRSGIELSHFELKQGVVSLGASRELNIEVIGRIINTISALANNGPERAGNIILGVADNEGDAEKIAKLDGIVPRKVGSWYVVGINREAKALGISLEDYHGVVRNAIAKSALSEPLKGAVLSSIDFNEYYGLGVIVISVPPQKGPSFVGDNMYWRDGDNTRLVEGMKQGADIGRRF